MGSTEGLLAIVDKPDDRHPVGELQIARDRRLVRGMLKGDQRILHAFYDEYFPKLYRYAARRMKSPRDIDEVVQSALAIAARRIETYRGEATLLAWLIQICRREVAKHYTVSAPYEAGMTRLDDDVLRAAVESLEAPRFDEPEWAARRSELVARVQLALDQLPGKYADVLQLKYFEGFSSKEIADKIGMQDEAVQSLLARARQAFREICSLALMFDTDTLYQTKTSSEEL
jgi:RNA polymerase sigma-70 factor (ECF subfamily)